MRKHGEAELFSITYQEVRTVFPGAGGQALLTFDKLTRRLEA